MKTSCDVIAQIGGKIEVKKYDFPRVKRQVAMVRTHTRLMGRKYEEEKGVNMEIIKDANELRNALYDLDRGQIIYASKKLVWKQIIGSIEGKSFSTRELQDKIEITCTR